MPVTLSTGFIEANHVKCIRHATGTFPVVTGKPAEPPRNNCPVGRRRGTFRYWHHHVAGDAGCVRSSAGAGDGARRCEPGNAGSRVLAGAFDPLSTGGVG